MSRITSRRETPRRRAAFAALVASAALLSGCFTGDRPRFDDEEPQSLGTGDPDIDLVIDRLNSTGGEQFTATYRIETKFGSLTSTGTVVQTVDMRRAVTVERPDSTTRFLEDPPTEQTCDLVSGTCESSLNDARISDVGIPHTFYGPSFATRLSVSADRRIDSSSAYSKPIAGQDARCVDVSVVGGVETFCALETGVLAQFVGNDVTIDLTAYSDDADESQLTVG